MRHVSLVFAGLVLAATCASAQTLIDPATAATH
jgi:hypothetical protein